MDRRLDDGSVWHDQLRSLDLIDLATRAFPSLVAVVQHRSDSIHLQMAALADEFIRRATIGDHESVAEVITFLEEALALGKPAPELVNALEISFLDADVLVRNSIGDEAVRGASPKLQSLIRGEDN